jgi:translocation and assembly module TamB
MKHESTPPGQAKAPGPGAAIVPLAGAAVAQAAPAVAHSSPAFARLLWGLLLPLLWVVLVLVLLGAALNQGVRWLTLSEDGARWLVARLPANVQVSGLKGALLGETLSAQRLRVEWADGREWLVAENLHLRGIQWQWRPDASHWLGIQVAQLDATRVQVETGPPAPRPLPLPKTLVTPVHLQVAQAWVAELQIDAFQPLASVQLRGVEVDGRPGASHHIERLALSGYGLQVAGGLKIANSAPYAVLADLTALPLGVEPASAGAPRAGTTPSAAATPMPSPPALPSTRLPAASPWAVALRASGPLATLDVHGALRSVPRPAERRVTDANASNAAASLTLPALDLRARVRPLLAWPVDQLSLSTQALDLSQFAADAPRTLLAGRVDIQAAARDAPISVRADLSNAAPGLWNDKRLPLSRLTAQLQGELARPDRLQAKAFELSLADAQGAAGQMSGQLLWEGTRLELQAQLLNVSPQRLDSRAATMVVSGPLQFKLSGVPALPTAAGTKPNTPRAGTAASRARTPAQPWQAQLEAELTGQVPGAPQTVHLRTQATAREGFLQIQSLQARAGAAEAQLQATLTRLGPAAGTQLPPLAPGTTAAATGQPPPWQVVSNGKLVNFDPLPWWPGEPGAAWRQGSNRVNAQWDLDVQVPADAQRLPPPVLAQRLAGNGTLKIVDSLLVGVPVSAELALSQAAAAAAAAPAATTAAAGAGAAAEAGAQASNSAPTSLRAELLAAGNRLSLQGAAQAAGPGQSDRWQVQVQAEQLQALAPLTRLHPYLAQWLPREGSVQAQFNAEGRWPRLRSEGQASVQRLRMGELAVRSAQAQWQLDLEGLRSGNAPLALQVQASEVQSGSQRVDRLEAALRGTLAEHRVELALTVPPLLNGPALKLLDIKAHASTRAQLLAQGQWIKETDGSARWVARVERLEVAERPAAAEGQAAEFTGTPSFAPLPSPWAQARDLRTELLFDAQGRVATLRAQPGLLRLANQFNMRWQAVQVDLRPAHPAFDVRAELDAFPLAPLLARWQPTVGWRGDLRMGLRLAVKAGDTFAAEVLAERTEGDLQFGTGEDVQALGLTTLRLAMGARDGDWVITPVASGRILGELGGSVHVRTGAQRRWPDAQAPIEGSLLARVANIDIWSHWIPPGWRMAGELRTQAIIGGNFGAPTYTGELSGNGLTARNLLQGVNVVDGQLRVRLSGDTAQVEQASARAGEGRLTLTGGATFGTSPKAQLQLQAERFKLLGRVDRSLTTSGTAQLSLAADTARVEGRFKVDEGLFDFSRADAPSLDDDVTIRGASTDQSQAAAAAAPARAATRLAVNLEVDLGERLHVRGRGLDADLQGKLRITNPGGRLEIRGDIEARNGTYAAYGQKLVIDRGKLSFTGPTDNPRLDVLALRPNLDLRVGVQMTGSLQAPRIRLFSDPEMAEQEKLSWLVLGRASEGLARADTALLQRAALALLAGEGEAPTDALMKALGIDELSFRQGDTDVRETVITLGKQLSRRWYLGYERGVNATTGTWQLVYRIAQRFTLRAQSGLDNSLDLIWVWRLQEPPAEAASGASGPMRKSLPAKPR